MFCQLTDDGQVVGHHLKVGHGMGMKASDALVIPVCYRCHMKCESYEITKEDQIHALLAYMIQRLAENHGLEKGLERLGYAYMEALHDTV